MRFIFLRSAQCTLRPGPLLTHDLGADHQREISHVVSLDATHARGLPDTGKKELDDRIAFARMPLQPGSLSDLEKKAFGIDYLRL